MRAGYGYERAQQAAGTRAASSPSGCAELLGTDGGRFVSDVDQQVWPSLEECHRTEDGDTCSVATVWQQSWRQMRPPR